MTGIDILRLLLMGSFGNIGGRLNALSDDDWDRRAIAGTSKVGFILWHAARILDWTHSSLAGVAEVAHGERWRDRFPKEALAGFGIPESAADRVTQTVSRTDTIEYLAEVKTAFLEWFDRQTPETLEAKVSLRTPQAEKAGYLAALPWDDISDLDGIPAWHMLLRPSGGHIRVHQGEYDTLLGLLRSAATPPA
jgi:DinB family protein